MVSFHCYLDSILLIFVFQLNSCQTDRPLVGILSQDSFTYGGHSFIAASYVKYLESAGARVVPILIDQNEEYYQRIINYTNGMLFPGGGQDLKDSGYARAGRKLWELSRNDPKRKYPIWATCLGFELLTSFYTDGHLSDCDAYDRSDKLTMDDDIVKDSRLFKSMTTDLKGLLDALKTEEITYNHHKKCIKVQDFDSKLKDNFKKLSTTKDKNGVEYVSTIESKEDYPIYGTQWHPEKNQFEWALNEKYFNIPHSMNAILIGQYMANFFVNECRKTSRELIAIPKESQMLIYNYEPIYTGAKVNYSYEQVYVFNTSDSNLWFVSYNYYVFVLILALNQII